MKRVSYRITWSLDRPFGLPAAAGKLRAGVVPATGKREESPAVSKGVRTGKTSFVRSTGPISLWKVAEFLLSCVTKLAFVRLSNGQAEEPGPGFDEAGRNFIRCSGRKSGFGGVCSLTNLM